MRSKVAIDINISAVERMLPLLPYIAANQQPPWRMVDELVSTLSMRLWLQHAARFSRLTEAGYREVISKAASVKELPTGTYLVDFLAKNAARSAELKRILDSFREIDLRSLCAEAYEAANGQLVQPFTEPINIHLVCATRGSAVVQGNNILIDMADFTDTAQTPLPLRDITSILAHEIFHMGRQLVLSKQSEQPDGQERWAYNMLHFLLEEGVATYFFTEGYIKQKARLYYFDSLRHLGSIVGWVNRVLIEVSEGRFTEEAHRRNIAAFTNMDGYVLGTEMCRVIDKVLGREALDKCLANTGLFLEVYNQAVTAKRLPMPMFSPLAVRRAKELCS